MKYAWVILLMGTIFMIGSSFFRRSTSLAAGPATNPSAPEFAGFPQATFSAGCFWGVEASLRRVPGVLATQVGYSGGHTADPDYREVCTETTGHAESVLVTYDPKQVSYPELLDAFFSLHDPTTVDQQGPDIGDQYRSVIFYHDAEQKALAEAAVAELTASHVFKRPIVTQILPATTFYKAEDYHQQYFEKQGSGESCHVGIAEVHTRLAKAAAGARKNRAATEPTTQASSCNPFDPNSTCGTAYWRSMTPEQMKARLTPEQFHIAREAGTEMPFTGKYWDEHRQGVYHCAVCGQALFASETKFESGTGWPSFFKPIAAEAVEDHDDDALGMRRTEVLCSRCHSHLGHVFDDGPQPTGKRYCMNSAVLDFHVGEKP